MSSLSSAQPSEAPAIVWRRIQAAATAAISLSLLSVLALSQELIPPVLVFGVLYLAVAAVVWRLVTSRWASIAGAVLVALGIAGNAPFLIEDISHPETWGSFAPAAVMLVGAVAAVGAAVMALRAAPVERARSFSMGALVLGAALVVATIGLSVATSSDTVEAGDVAVVADGAEFPETLEIAAGGAGIYLENKDLLRHTFVIEDQDVKVELPGGKTRRVEVDLPAGEYRFLCDVPGHERMEGTLTVR